MTPIIIGEEAIRDLDNKQLHDWLNRRESHLFQVWLVSEAAKLAAEAGNHLIEGSETGKTEANLAAEESKLYSRLADLIAEMRNPDKPFTAVTLKPKPIDTTIP
ncbi:MAG TPA: hypothetical protein VFU31_00555 [Candidatus Binatia bacterium]|nr:hypothetical protein [Candidatus Binatia bacterium]